MKTELLGPLEKQVMEILWSSPCPLKPLEVKHQLKGDYAYTTVMTILKRLADKDFACREPHGKAYVYSPCQPKDKFIKHNLSGIYHGLVGSYGQIAISQFVDTLKSNPDDLKLLADYLKKNS